MGRCGCDSPDGCQCAAQAGSLGEVTVAGTGTVGDPFVVDDPSYQIVADKAAVDAIASPQHGWRAFATGEGEFGVEYRYNGAIWVPDGPQKLQRVELSADGTITLDELVQDFQELVIKYSVRGARASTVETLECFIDGDTTDANYHKQTHYADNGAVVSNESSEPWVAVISAANSPANAYGTGEVHIVNYAEASRMKHLWSSFVALRDTNQLITGQIGMVHEDGATDAIDTSLLLDGTNADLLSGSWAELWGY